jgi:hypothetical protein
MELMGGWDRGRWSKDPPESPEQGLQESGQERRG